MQFKHPEILWFLLLLLIPILIHLFQLRRFKKTPFTNVAMLQKVISESRKSNTLKKWLLLCTRLLLLACLVIAFAQPFLAKSTALKTKETVIYLDNSFSMQARNGNISLLEKAVQDLLKNIPNDSRFSLFTNTQTFSNVTMEQIQNNLLQLESTGNQLQFENLVLKAKGLFSKDESSLKNLIVLSDFQERLGKIEVDSTNMVLHAVHLKPTAVNNVTIDSIYLGNDSGNQLELNVLASGLNTEYPTALSLYNSKRLIAKTALTADTTGTGVTKLSIPKNERILGKLVITDNSLQYDNSFYFSIDERPKIKVLVIGERSTDYLSRIYTEDEFAFSKVSLKNLNYSQITSQNLIVLNELQSVPLSLQNALTAYVEEGGGLVVIPNENIDLVNYKGFLVNHLAPSFVEKVNLNLDVSNIVFDHPIYSNVFENRVSNFDYPKVSMHYSMKGSGSNVLNLSNGDPFLISKGNTYIFSSPLNKELSTFQNSPLIVPTFYKMGMNSLKLPPLYFSLGDRNEIDLPTILEKDNIIKLSQNETELIPVQRSFPNKVTLTLDENNNQEGIFSIMKQTDTLTYLGLNHKRDESDLRYQELNEAAFATLETNIPTIFQRITEDNTINAYWKWFVIFAITLALVELLIQKFLA